jgi:hypothetical protein
MTNLGDKTNMLFIIVGYKVPFMDVSNKVFVLTADVKIQERLENYEIHLLTNGNVLDDINKIYKGIKIVPNGSNSEPQAYYLSAPSRRQRPFLIQPFF